VSLSFNSLSRVLSGICLAVALAGSMSAAEDAHAETISCSGINFEKPGIDSYVSFDFSASTCTITDGGASLTGLDDIQFMVFVAASSQERFQYGLGGAATSTVPSNSTGCTIGSFSAGASSSCLSDRSTNGSETASTTITASDGSLISLDVGYTIASSGVYVDITSASVTITTASTTSANTDSAAQAMQDSVSRSQAAVVGKNVEARLASAFMPNGRSLTSSISKDPSASSSPQFSTFRTNSDTERRAVSRGGSIRELAMLASFDTSRIVLGAVDDEQDPSMDIEQRQALISDRPYTVWGHGSFTRMDNDRNRTDDDTRYDGDVWGYNMGVDYGFRPDVIAGVSLGYSETDLTTTFNSGTYNETNRTLSPYAMYQPVDGLTLSMIAGYSIGDVNRTRDTTVTGSTGSGMWFTSLGSSYKLYPSEVLPLDVTARLSFLASRKAIEGFNESDSTHVDKTVSNTRRLKPGVEVAYNIDAQGTMVQPFVKGDYVYDFTDKTNDDSGAYDLGGGLRLTSGETGLSGSIEAESQLGRDDYNEYTVSGLVSFGFSVNGEGAGPLGIASPYIKSNFNPDTGQVFGTGIKFTSDGGALNCELSLTHAQTTVGTPVVDGQVRAELRF